MRVPPIQICSANKTSKYLDNAEDEEGEVDAICNQPYELIGGYQRDQIVIQ